MGQSRVLPTLRLGEPLHGVVLAHDRPLCRGDQAGERVTRCGGTEAANGAAMLAVMAQRVGEVCEAGIPCIGVGESLR
jgi:hypothetical protein